MLPIVSTTLSFAVVVAAGVWEPGVGSAPRAPLASLPAVATAALQSCGDERRTNNHISQNSNDDEDRRTTVRWSAGDCEVELRARGRFTVKGDLSDFDSLSRDGWVTLSEERGRETREMRLTNEGGRLARTYKVNGSERAWDADGQRWLASLLLELERRTAFAADQRVPRLLATGGPAAVIDEVARLHGDYAAHVYFAKLFEKVPRLDAPLVRRVLNVAAERVTSDYYRTEILKAVERRGLPDDAARLAYVEAASGITSDYYRAEALKLMLDDGATLSRTVGDALLRAAVRIGSDYYASETLKRAATRGLVRTENRSTFFDAVRGVNSDYYRAEILLGLIRGDSLDPATVQAAVTATDGMSSDHYVTEVLLATARRYALQGDTRAAYVRAANTIKSDHYHRQAMSALVRQTMLQ